MTDSKKDLIQRITFLVISSIVIIAVALYSNQYKANVNTEDNTENSDIGVSEEDNSFENEVITLDPSELDNDGVNIQEFKPDATKYIQSDSSDMSGFATETLVEDRFTKVEYTGTVLDSEIYKRLGIISNTVRTGSTDNFTESFTNFSKSLGDELRKIDILEHNNILEASETFGNMDIYGKDDYESNIHLNMQPDGKYELEYTFEVYFREVIDNRDYDITSQLNMLNHILGVNLSLTDLETMMNKCKDSGQNSYMVNMQIDTLRSIKVTGSNMDNADVMRDGYIISAKIAN